MTNASTHLPPTQCFDGKSRETLIAKKEALKERFLNKEITSKEYMDGLQSIGWCGFEKSIPSDQCIDMPKFDSFYEEIKKQMEAQPLQFYKSTKEYALIIAAKVPVTCLQELFDNAEKIQEWLKEPTVSINDDHVHNYFDCSAV